jgi:hypothetical protein
MRDYMNIINESAKLQESTGAECEFIEWKPGQWYYAFERFTSDEEKYNWRDEEVDCYGPFKSYEEADADLVANHANPGGHNILDHNDVKQSHYIKEYQYWVEHAEAPQVREQVVNELAFDGTDQGMEAAFDNLCSSLNIHESGMNKLARALEQDRSFSREIDQRSPINKVTPEQWARLNQALAPYFVVRFEAPTLTILAAK